MKKTTKKRYISKRGIFLNKKAQGDIESYFVIIKLILAISVIAAMSVYVYSIYSDTFFEKLYLSRDMAFTANTAYFAPGNVYVQYERGKMDKFTLDFEDQKVNLREDDPKKTGLPFSYFYASNLNYKLEKEKIKNSKKIIFQKSSDIVEIKGQSDQKLKLLKCARIDTIDKEWNNKFFLIDLGQGYNRNNIKGDIILNSIGFNLYKKFENKYSTKENIDTSIEEQTRKSERKTKELIEESDVIISLHMGDSSTNNNIKAYFSFEEDEGLTKKREKLSCLILNELLSDKELDQLFTGGNIIKVNPKHIKTDYEKILDNGKLSIILEIGNIQSERIKDLEEINNAIKISDSIYEGVKIYYESN